MTLEQFATVHTILDVVSAQAKKDNLEMRIESVKGVETETDEETVQITLLFSKSS